MLIKLAFKGLGAKLNVSFRAVNGFLFSLKLKSFIFTETLLYTCPTLTSFFLEIILKFFIHQEQLMLHPISLSFSFSTVRPPPRNAWIKTPGNIRGPGTIGLSFRTRALLQDLKTSRASVRSNLV